MDDSEIIVYELNNAIVNLYKLILEESGYDLGQTRSFIEYRNYTINDPTNLNIDINNNISNKFENDPNNISIPDPNIEINPNATLGNLTVDKLMKIFKNGKRNYVAACLSVLDKYGSSVGLTDKGKLYILAQFAHESGGFIYTAELGKGKGRAYGRPTGPYGKIYYGRGPIQITWDYNYKAITEKYFPKIGISADIYKDPDLCERNLEIGCAASLCWFMMPGNGKRAIAAANNGDIKKLSKAINGGYNGLQDRINKTQKILQLSAS